jgi:hypothetical protein
MELRHYRQSRVLAGIERSTSRYAKRSPGI